MEQEQLPPPAISKNNWLFVLGRERLLSAAEIAAFFSRQKTKYEIKKNVEGNLIIATTENLIASELIQQFGGTIKIAKQLDISLNGLAYFLNQFLTHGKINFALNGFGKHFSLQLKKELKAMGRLARYVEIKNSASLLFNNLINKGAELTLIDGKIFITQALQTFREFSNRDYGRPGRDSRSGMLPPKLAVMMINLASVPQSATLLDPFCGSGTIATEALLLGYRNIIINDIAEKAVTLTRQNLDWIKEKEKNRIDITNLKLQIFSSDVKKISTNLKTASIDAIITEPYLGKPLKGTENENELKKQMIELKQLYIGAFEQFFQILKTNGIVIFIIPCFRYRSNLIRIDCLDEIKKLGFEPVPLWEDRKFLLYSRPDQHVGREIWKFFKI